MTNKTRICSIDFFRYFCSIIVIGIHTSVLNDISSVAGEVFLDVFSRIAVPFFFAVSGYFYIQKLEHNKKVFKNYFIRLIVTYSAWSIVYFILDFITWGHINLKGFVTNCLYSYFIIGSHYHLWFLHSLILCICLVTVFYKLHIQKILVPISLVTFTIGCLGSAYYNVIGKSIPFLNSIFDSSFYVQIKHFPLFSLSFFVCGYVIYRMHKKFEKATNKKINKIVILSVFSAIIWLSEIILIKNKNLGRDTTITIGLYFLIISIIFILLKYPMPKANKASKACLTIANFVYFSHPFFIETINLFFEKLYIERIPETLMFLIITLITTIIGVLIFKADNRHLNRLI